MKVGMWVWARPGGHPESGRAPRPRPLEETDTTVATTGGRMDVAGAGSGDVVPKQALISLPHFSGWRRRRLLAREICSFLVAGVRQAELGPSQMSDASMCLPVGRVVYGGLICKRGPAYLLFSLGPPQEITPVKTARSSKALWPHQLSWFFFFLLTFLFWPKYTKLSLFPLGTWKEWLNEEILGVSLFCN